MNIEAIMSTALKPRTPANVIVSEQLADDVDGLVTLMITTRQGVSYLILDADELETAQRFAVSNLVGLEVFEAGAGWDAKGLIRYLLVLQNAVGRTERITALRHPIPAVFGG